MKMEKNQIHEAKWWLFEHMNIDCTEYSDSDIPSMLDAHYEGGTNQFLLDIPPENPFECKICGSQKAKSHSEFYNHMLSKHLSEILNHLTVFEAFNLFEGRE